MVDAVRIYDGTGWSYVSAEDDVLLRHAANRGMTKLAKHDGDMHVALSSHDEDSINILPSSRLSFGRKPGKYNSFANLTLSDGPPGMGVSLSLASLSKDDIVMTLWPEDGRIIPGRIVGTDKRYLLELAESQDKGKRCFVLDERCRSLLTASLSSEGELHVRLLPPVAISSWMIATGAEPVLDARRSFVMEQDEDCFVITDMARNRKYLGFLTQQDAEDRKCEAGLIERMLMTVGIGAILPNYRLKIMGDQK